MRLNWMRRLGWVLAWIALLPRPLLACATCFGASDEPMAKGMNMGILALLGVVVFVLGLFGAFFVFLARRSVHTPMPRLAPTSNELEKA